MMVADAAGRKSMKVAVVQAVTCDRVLEDVLCDLCGRSCRVQPPQERVYASHASGHLREEEFSYARLEFAGDYYGRYDGINFSLQICEECAIGIYRSSRAVQPDHRELLGSSDSGSS
jgi:hypothetical protein